jgi:uncharacterized protein (TIGR03435 family)
MRKIASIGSFVIFSSVLFAQTPPTAPQFEAADIHVSPKRQNQPTQLNQLMRTSIVRNSRYEVRTATMLDLIRVAWLLDADKILDGPNWLELDRFDVIAKVPRDTTPETQRLMLQALLKDRFKLTVHEDKKPVPTWTLSAGKNPRLKEADGTGETGCKLQTGSPAANGQGPRLMIGNANGGPPQTINIGPDNTLQYVCRNMTMAAFAEGMRSMLGAQINTPVTDQTGIKGMWNFDIRWSLPLFGPNASGAQISAADAVEKQLGLKLQQVPVPTTVLVVESADRKPTDNSPEIAAALPVTAAPTEFEVADVKLANPVASGSFAPMRFSMQPGGRFVSEGFPMRLLLSRAFNTNNNDQIAGVPSWADSVRVDITAKAPSDAAPSVNDPEFIAPMLLSLLRERFGLKYHTEDRQVSAYSLVATKPKLKKADSDSRIFCKNLPPNPKAGPNAQVVNCQNATMAFFAERLMNIAPGLTFPVEDATGLEGAWDFTLSFSPFAQAMRIGGARGPGGPDAGPNAAAAADPVVGDTIFEAVEKQLGLKLQSQKRMAPVIVIDHLEQKPTEN